MANNKEVRYFGETSAIGDLPTDKASHLLREVGDHQAADELESFYKNSTTEHFDFNSFFSFSFSRYHASAHICGFMPARNDQTLKPASKTTGNKALIDQPLTISLFGLHVANYPGGGKHNILFDFVVDNLTKKTPAFHFNSKISAKDGETVAVQNMPIFRSLKAGKAGLTFGFQTVNLKSSREEQLLKFLGGKSFKEGLSLLNDTDPVLGQFSKMASNLASWSAQQSKNIKVQEFQIGLGFDDAQLNVGLDEGYYVIAQIPKDYEYEFDWAEWEIDANFRRLVRKNRVDEPLEFNHIIISINKAL